jgi:hypothetical protein
MLPPAKFAGEVEGGWLAGWLGVSNERGSCGRCTKFSLERASHLGWRQQVLQVLPCSSSAAASAAARRRPIGLALPAASVPIGLTLADDSCATVCAPSFH